MTVSSEQSRGHKDFVLSVFITHKRDVEIDDRIALSLANDLESLGCRVFLDYKQRAAIEIDEELVGQLDNTDFVIALISRSAHKSEWVKIELERAASLYADHGRPRIVPIRLNFKGNYSPRLAVCLNRFAAIDSNGNDYLTLLARVKSALGLGPPIDDTVRRSNQHRTKIFIGIGVGVFLVFISFWWLAGLLDSSARIINPVKQATPAEAESRSTPSPPSNSSHVAGNSTSSAGESPGNRASRIRNPILFEAFSDAYKQSKIGTPENDERARELYLKAINNMSPNIRASLDSTCSSLLTEAENDYRRNDAHTALTKFDTFFTSCFDR